MAVIQAILQIFGIAAIVAVSILTLEIVGFYLAAYTGDATGWFRIENHMRTP
jgi:predicted membrane protein